MEAVTEVETVPRTVPIGRSEITFVEGSYVSDSDHNYEGAFLNGMRLKYHVVPRTPDSLHWYTFGLETTNNYIIRIYGKNEEIVPGKLVLYMEYFDCNLEDWVKQQEQLVDNEGQRLERNFAVLLMEVLRGILFLHKTSNRPHGEICARNIYVINGHAKLANLPDAGRKTQHDDYRNFEKTVKDLFRLKNSEPPSELKSLCQGLQYVENMVDLANSLNHPVFLKPSERFSYYIVAQYMVNYSDNIFRVNFQIERLLQGRLWRTYVTHPAFVRVLNYRPPESPSRQSQAPPSQRSQASPNQRSQAPPSQRSGQRSQAPPSQRSQAPPSQRSQRLMSQPSSSTSQPFQALTKQPLQAFHSPTGQQPQPPQSQYDDSPILFLRFGRNACLHARNREGARLTKEEIEEELDRIWPGFLVALHEVLSMCDIYVREIPEE